MQRPALLGLRPTHRPLGRSHRRAAHARASLADLDSPRGRRGEAFDVAVRNSLGPELDEIARIGEALDCTTTSGEALDQVYRRIEAIESKLSPRSSVTWWRSA
jgi:hypothetical protein